MLHAELNGHPIDRADATPTDLLPELQRLLELWEDHRGEHPLPRRADFPAEVLFPWMGHIGIVSLRSGNRRFFVDLAGTQITVYDGRDFTGKYLEDAVPPHAVSEIVAPYEAVISHSRPVYSRLPPGTLAGSFSYLDRLILPCGDDRKTVDRFIVGIYVSQFQSLKGNIYGNPEQASPSTVSTEKRRDKHPLMIL